MAIDVDFKIQLVMMRLFDFGLVESMPRATRIGIATGHPLFLRPVTSWFTFNFPHEFCKIKCLVQRQPYYRRLSPFKVIYDRP